MSEHSQTEKQNQLEELILTKSWGEGWLGSIIVSVIINLFLLFLASILSILFQNVVFFLFPFNSEVVLPLHFSLAVLITFIFLNMSLFSQTSYKWGKDKQIFNQIISLKTEELRKENIHLNSCLIVLREELKNSKIKKAEE